MGFLSKTLSELAKDKIGGIPEPFRSGANDILTEAFPGLGPFSSASASNFGNRPTSALDRAGFENEISQFVLPDESTVGDNNSLEKSYDWRARLRPKNGGVAQLYRGAKLAGTDGAFADYLLAPIEASNGMIWQYTPQVFITSTADYHPHELVGSNYAIPSYIKTRGVDNNFPVTAPFTANNIYEARYLLAVMTFLKVVTKSYYGEDALNDADGDGFAKYGTPPPVLLFEYLGDHGFNKVPVVVVSYQIEYPDNVDYVPVVIGGGTESDETTTTYVPTETRIAVNLMPYYTPRKLRKKFTVDGIANGYNYKDGFL